VKMRRPYGKKGYKRIAVDIPRFPRAIFQAERHGWARRH